MLRLTTFALSCTILTNRLPMMPLCGADPSMPDDAGSTPLHFATERGVLSLVNHLLGLSVDVNSKDLFSRMPLHLAFYNTNLEVVASLLKGGSDPRALEGYGRSALD